MKRSGQFWNVIVTVFVLIGFIATIVTAVWMVRDQLNDTYPILVRVNDAGGLQKGAPVEFGGLEVGRVAEMPYFVSDYTALLVPLEIHGDITLPEGAIVLVDSSERHDGTILKITMPEQKPERFVQKNDIMNGFRVDRDQLKQKNMGDSLDQFQKSMESLATTSATLDRLISLLEKTGGGASSGVGSLSSIDSSMKAFEKTNVKMSDTIDRLDALLLTTGEGMKKIDSSIANFDRSMLEIQTMADTGGQSFQKIYDLADQNTETTKDFHLAVNEFRGLIDEVNPLLASVRNGEGLLKTLIEDEELSSDVRSFADKLEKRGVLFYPKEKKVTCQAGFPEKKRFGRRF